MSEQKAIKTDSGGFEALKPAILSLVNEYPDLNGRVITFQGLTEESGISVEPESGALVFAEQPDIIGGIHQKCQFPFFVVYRSNATSEYLKLEISEFLDNLGAWLCREPVTINGTKYRLDIYPQLTGGRKITGMSRFNSYSLVPNANRSQDWVIPVTVHYTHDFTKC